MDGLTVVSHVADFVTLAAAALTFAGALGYVLSRPRPKIALYGVNASEVQVLVHHAKGSRKLYGLYHEVNVHGPEDSKGWDGPVARVLEPGEEWHFFIVDTYREHDGRNTTIISAAPTSTCMLALRWERPILRWMVSRWQVVLWTAEDRAAGRGPNLYRGRRAAAARRESLIASR